MAASACLFLTLFSFWGSGLFFLSDYGLPRTSVRFRSASKLGPIPLCLKPRSDYGLPRTSVRFRSASNLGPIPVCLEPHRAGLPRFRSALPLPRGVPSSPPSRPTGPESSPPPTSSLPIPFPRTSTLPSPTSSLTSSKSTTICARRHVYMNDNDTLRAPLELPKIAICVSSGASGARLVRDQ